MVSGRGDDEGTSRDPSWLDRALDGRDLTGDRPAGSDSTMPLPVVPDDGLAEIRWADTPEVVPAGTPIAPQPTTRLVPEAIGRSAWDDELRAVGTKEPDGWDRLSWQDLDGDEGERPVHDATPFGRVLREWGPVLLGAIVIALIIRLLLFQAYHIPSLSMAPTLGEGDRVIVNRLSYQFGDIQRGQVVVFNKPPNQPTGANDLIKRVIGLSGETVQFNDGKVYIDGLLVQEPYLAVPESTRPRSFSIPGCAQDEPSPSSCTIPDGYVFVMGDNRAGSQDSRTFGPIPEDSVVGRAFLRVWPLNSVGGL